MPDKIKPFEKIFPYLSYRWRYDDGEYSPYAPFTEVQFLSVIDVDDSERYKNGFNVFMTNNLEDIKITKLPIGREDVVAVDILYTESISSTIYTLRTIEIPVVERKNNFLYDIVIPRRSIGTALPNNQLSRHFDNVPLKAKSQEITANRLIYGNYTHQFNQGINEIGEDGFKIAIDTWKKLNGAAGPSVKTNRNYTVGVIYIDEYGRQGSLLTQQTSLDGDNGSAFKTRFTYNARIGLSATIKSKMPSWAKYYRYFIKDTSNAFYNMSAFNTYIDGDSGDFESANVYLQFDSKDRNKITEDSFLIPKRSTHENASGDIPSQIHRLPILSIENEAPDIVKNQVLEKNINSISGAASLNNTTALLTDSSGVALAQTTTNQTEIYFTDKNGGLKNTAIALSTFIQSQDNTQPVFETGSNSSPGAQAADCTGFAEPLLVRFESEGTSASSTLQKTDYLLVDTIRYVQLAGTKGRNALHITVSNRVSDDGTIKSTTQLGVAINFNGSNISRFKFAKVGLSETGQEKLKGSFFVKVPRNFQDSDSITAGITKIPIGQTELNENGDVKTLKVVDFETEALEESNLDLYWESANTFTEQNHGEKNNIFWSNCIARLGDYPSKIYTESTRMLDKFNSTELVKSIRVNTPVARFAEEVRKAGLIFSGLYNSRTGLNELNQFSMADGITKELEPNYGGIQKLYTLDTNLIAFAEDKVFRILADKDALFNADEGVNVTATNLVLGQAMVYQGDYGISTHPESFAFFRNNLYFTDAKRGNVLQLTPANGQIFPISSRGMSNFFRDRIGTADKLIGAYDGYKKIYVLSMQGYDQTAASIGSETIPNETSNITLGYSLVSEGWTSRYSFIPESGVTVNNQFYTFKDGKAYLHNSDTPNRNNFYGVAYNSEVQVIFNDNPTFVSDWLSLNYDGSEGWEVVEIIGDQDSSHSITNVRLLDSEESGFLGWFLKEGKYHGAIVGTQPVYIINPSATQPGSDGFWPLIQDGTNTQDISGTKGFFQKTRFRNSGTTAKELFAVSSEYYISQT